MPYSITCSTKILTLAIAPFLFVLLRVLCRFAIVSSVFILLSPREEVGFNTIFLRVQMKTFSNTFIKDI